MHTPFGTNCNFQTICIYAWADNKRIWCTHLGRKCLNQCTPFGHVSQWNVGHQSMCDFLESCNNWTRKCDGRSSIISCYPLCLRKNFCPPFTYEKNSNPAFALGEKLIQTLAPPLFDPQNVLVPQMKKTGPPPFTTPRNSALHKQMVPPSQ